MNDPVVPRSMHDQLAVELSTLAAGEVIQLTKCDAETLLKEFNQLQQVVHGFTAAN